jgi:hypothetical protein
VGEDEGGGEGKTHSSQPFGFDRGEGFGTTIVLIPKDEKRSSVLLAANQFPDFLDPSFLVKILSAEGWRPLKSVEAEFGGKAIHQVEGCLCIALAFDNEVETAHSSGRLWGKQEKADRLDVGL